ncbi:hypothetical protein BGY98DRAFT_978043 [Russula aff. rugulosa BPL654]|nr:hypothetical protein BGY98DRAFT_978043 [Russula aff. rugulosa BPL654]
MILSCNESATRTHHTALGPIQTLRLRHQFIGLALFGIYKRLANPYLISNTSQCVIPDASRTSTYTRCRLSPFHPANCVNCKKTCWQYRQFPEQYAPQISSYCPSCSGRARRG